MELGARLRQARLDAGLSQRQLCQDTITRNMLSQIENNSARPSMDTLRILAGRLGKPIGYFLEEEAILSPNLGLLNQIQSLSGQAVLDALKSYQSPDSVCDRERYLIEALTCLDLAEAAVKDGKQRYAATLLEQAENAGKQTPYYTPEIQRRHAFLCFEAGILPAELLTPNPQKMLTLAKAALESGNADACHHLLALVQPQDASWHLLQGMAYLQEENYAQAAEHLPLATPTNPVYSALETCYRELGNFEKAYFYACKQR